METDPRESQMTMEAAKMLNICQEHYGEFLVLLKKIIKYNETMKDKGCDDE